MRRLYAAIGLDAESAGHIVARMSDGGSSRNVAPMLSYFWAPLCAVGGHNAAGPNAQICVGVFGASIVPDRPRIAVLLSKTNHTTGLVRETGTLAVTLLAETQLDLLEPLGTKSGRDGDKLTGLNFELTSDGDPVFPGGVGTLACHVLRETDMGDAILFLCAIRSQQQNENAAPPMNWASARERLPGDVVQRYLERNARDQEIARERMIWRE